MTRAAAAYTLLGTARLSGLNVDASLRHVREKLPAPSADRVEKLRPRAVAAQLPEIRLAPDLCQHAVPSPHGYT